MISPEEYAYLLDLHLFLGKPLKIILHSNAENNEDAVGKFPTELIEEQHSVLINWHESYTDLVS